MAKGAKTTKMGHHMMGLLALLASGCLQPGDEPYAGWEVAQSVGGGFSIRYLEPPWEVDLSTPPPAIGLQVPFQHSAPIGLPDPPPSYLFLATPGLAGATDQLAQGAEQLRLATGDVTVAATRPIVTRSGMPGHEVITLDVLSRFHREVFVTMPTGSVVHMGLESNDDADARDVDDLCASLEATE
jgi:hypothetical protein